VDDVVVAFTLCRDPGAVVHRAEVLATRDDPLADQEAGDELEVVPRRAHGDGEGAPVQPDLQRLLTSEYVGPRAGGPVPRQAGHPPRLRHTRHPATSSSARYPASATGAGASRSASRLAHRQHGSRIGKQALASATWLSPRAVARCERPQCDASGAKAT